MSRWRSASLAVVVLAAVGGASIGCGGASDRNQKLPECPGGATGDYDLGSAVFEAMPKFPRSGKRQLATGEATVLLESGSLRQIVSIRVCAPSFSEDELRDTATELARAVARKPLLGDRVTRFRVENYSTGESLASDPFVANIFRSNATTPELRPHWVHSTP